MSKNKCGIASGAIAIVVAIIIIAFGALLAATIALDLGGYWTKLVIEPAQDSSPQPETVGFIGDIADEMSELILDVPTSAQPALAVPVILLGIACLVVGVFCIKRTKNIKNVFVAFGIIELILSMVEIGIVVYLYVMGTALIPWLIVAAACGVVGIIMASLKLAAFTTEKKREKMACLVLQERAAARERIKNAGHGTSGKTLSKPIAIRRTNIETTSSNGKNAETAKTSKKKRT